MLWCSKLRKTDGGIFWRNMSFIAKMSCCADGMAVSENSKSFAFNYLTDFCRGKNKHIKSSFLFFKLMLHVLFIYISTLCKLKGFLNSHRHQQQHTPRHFCYRRHISIFTIFSLQFCSWIPNLLLYHLFSFSK